MVHRSIVDKWNFRSNCHGGPTFHPRKDSDHCAAYLGSSVYGATWNEICKKVYGEPIYAQVLFGMTSNLTPICYLQIGGDGDAVFI